MKQETFEITADSLEEARSQSKAKITPGLFLLSERIISDGKPVAIREKAEKTDAAIAAAKAKVPSGFHIEQEKEIRPPVSKTIRLSVENEDGARTQAESQVEKTFTVKKVTLAIPGKKGFLGIGKTQNQYDIELFQQAEAEISYKTDARISVTICGEDTLKAETTAQVRKAIDIVNRQVILAPVFQVKDAGDSGPVMEAATHLKQASGLEPDKAILHYAYVGALRLAAQFKAADEENAKLMGLHPDFALSRFSFEAWKGGAVISPSPFAFPEWTTTATTLPDYYRDKIRTFTLFPAREGIYPRAVLFEKDGEGWWTKERLSGVRTEVAVILVPGHPNVAAIYRRCTGPGLAKPDMQESLAVLDVPKDYPSLVGWEYLVEALFVDVVVVDSANNVVLNQRIPICPETRTTLGRGRDILLKTQGRKISNQEALTALQRYQSGADLDEIGRKYFPK